MSFICEGCGKTWPDIKNQDREAQPDGTFSATAGSGVCPDCHEEEDDDPRSQTPTSHPWGGRP